MEISGTWSTGQKMRTVPPVLSWVRAGISREQRKGNYFSFVPFWMLHMLQPAVLVCACSLQWARVTDSYLPAVWLNHTRSQMVCSSLWCSLHFPHPHPCIFSYPSLMALMSHILRTGGRLGDCSQSIQSFLPYPLFTYQLTAISATGGNIFH